MFGSKKYDWNGWKEVDDRLQRYNNAMGRHFVAEGPDLDDVDEESGLLVAAHTAWNALAKLEILLEECDET